MIETVSPPTPSGRVVKLLWAAARRRAAGRIQRQRQILGRRGSGQGMASLGRFLAIIVACMVHVFLAFFVVQFAKNAGRADAERDGRIVIAPAQWALLENYRTAQESLDGWKRQVAASPQPTHEMRRALLQAERSRDEALTSLELATRRSGRKRGTKILDYRRTLAQQFAERGMAGFTPLDDSLVNQLARSRQQPATVVPILGLALLVWVGMLVCQGEGLELDVQRRRHPMWEWLLSHPIKPASAFYAELLSPLMTNPIYFSAPIFLLVLFGWTYDVGVGLLMAIGVGLPVAVVASCAYKAIENLALLRLSVRSRGAVLGILSWFGYIAMVLPFFSQQAAAVAGPFVQFGAWLSRWLPAWPVRALTYGWGAEPNLAAVFASWWVVVLSIGGLAIWIVHRATARGLDVPTTDTQPKPARLISAESKLGANPLQRKELLWLLRDKGAIVQVVLIPLTIAGLQAFNLRNVVALSSTSWPALCGLAIICGTYFLLVLGPRSLASEGGALWLALTWPRGLEDLLKAKARLWGRVATGAVMVVLAVAVFLFPHDWWKIVLVAAGWVVFCSTLALKSVSLVTAPSSSGEPEPQNRARQWIAMIGTLAFGTGVVTGAWQVAVMGIVFSSLIAVAMWQGLRAHLPYLFDPWSEKPVPAPSLIHATVGIGLLVECIGVASGIAYAVGGPSSLWAARTVGYVIAGTIGCIVMQSFLSRRGVRLREIVRWPGARPRFSLLRGFGLALAGSAAIATLAIGYLQIVREIPAARDALDEAAKLSAKYPGEKTWLFVLAVVFAPLTEEYFFRGLLFRTIDRDLGGWRALALSAAFFAIVHPPVAWLPVFGMGVFSAWLFRNTRHLGPSVLCHMTYNAVIVLLT